MLKRFFIGLLVLVVLGVVGIAILSWRPAIAAIAPPTASSFSPELIKKGEVVANTGFCETCHTGAGGKPYAGGYAFKTPFGTIYSTNITPDADTGIGAWSQDAFARHDAGRAPRWCAPVPRVSLRLLHQGTGR